MALIKPTKGTMNWHNAMNSNFQSLNTDLENKMDSARLPEMDVLARMKLRTLKMQLEEQRLINTHNKSAFGFFDTFYNDDFIDNDNSDGELVNGVYTIDGLVRSIKPMVVDEDVTNSNTVKFNSIFPVTMNDAIIMNNKNIYIDGVSHEKVVSAQVSRTGIELFAQASQSLGVYGVDSDQYGNVYGIAYASEQIKCIKYNPDTNTITDLNFPTDGTLNHGPRIVVDNNNDLHVIWVGNLTGGSTLTVKYAKYINGIWSPIEHITSSVTPNGSRYPDIAVDSNNNLHVIFSGKHTSPFYHIMYTMNEGNGWSDPIRITTVHENTRTQTSTKIGVGKDDVVHVMYAGTTDITGYSSSTQIRYTYKKDDVWTHKDNIISLANQTQDLPDFVIDDNNVIHVTWEGEYTATYGSTRQIMYAKLVNHKMSGSLEIIHGTSSYAKREPSIMINNANELYIVGKSTLGAGSHDIIWDSHKPIDGSWSAISTVFSETGNTQSLPRTIKKFKNFLAVPCIWSNASRKMMYGATTRFEKDVYTCTLNEPVTAVANDGIKLVHDHHRNLKLTHQDFSHELALISRTQFNSIRLSLYPKKIKYLSGIDSVNGSNKIKSTDNLNIGDTVRHDSSNIDIIDKSTSRTQIDFDNNEALRAVTKRPNSYLRFASTNKIAKDSRGNLYVVYYQGASNPYKVGMSIFLMGEQRWIDAPPLPIPGESLLPSIQIDDDDVVHVIYSEGPSTAYHMYYIKYSLTKGKWYDRKLIDNIGNSIRCTFVFDKDKNIHLAYMRKATSHYAITYRNIKKNVLSPATTIKSSTSYDQHDPSIAIDKAGMLHLIWSGTDSTNTRPYTIMYTVTDSTHPLWTGTQGEVSGSLYTHYNPSVQVDDELTVHFFWNGQHASGGKYGPKYRYKTKGGSWGGIEQIPSTDTYHDYNVSGAIGKDGTLHAIWQNSIASGNYRIRMAKKSPGGSWNMTEVVQGNYDYAFMARFIDGDTPIYMYVDRDGNPLTIRGKYGNNSYAYTLSKNIVYTVGTFMSILPFSTIKQGVTKFVLDSIDDDSFNYTVTNTDDSVDLSIEFNQDIDKLLYSVYM